MSEDQEQEGNPLSRIPLDGTFGSGPMCEITVITRIPNSTQMKEETFEIPYWLLHMQRLQMLNDVNLIAGYRIVKGEMTSTALKDLGLS